MDTAARFLPQEKENPPPLTLTKRGDLIPPDALQLPLVSGRPALPTLFGVSPSAAPAPGDAPTSLGVEYSQDNKHIVDEKKRSVVQGGSFQGRDREPVLRGRCLSAVASTSVVPQLSSGRPFNDYAALFLAWIQPQVGEGRASNYRLAFGHLGQILGETPVDKLSGLSFEAMAEACRRGGFSTSWAALVRGVLRVWMRWAIRHRLVDSVLIYDLDDAWPEPKQEISRKYLHLGVEEEDKLCANSPPWLARFIHLAVCFGFRVSTLLALRWEWISPGWMLVVPKEFLKNGKELKYPISTRAQSFLGPRGPGLLFKDHRAKTNINEQMKAAGKLAGFPVEVWKNLSPHQLRRTWCLRAHSAGVTKDQAMDLQGWSGRHVLVLHYWPKQSDAEKRELAERM